MRVELGALVRWDFNQLYLTGRRSGVCRRRCRGSGALRLSRSTDQYVARSKFETVASPGRPNRSKPRHRLPDRQRGQLGPQVDLAEAWGLLGRAADGL